MLEIARLCLEHADRPAWLLTRSGEVLHENRHARGAGTEAELASRFARGQTPPSDWRVELLLLADEALCVVVRTSIVAAPEEHVRTARDRLGLTARETQVLALVGSGLANKEIADRLGCAASTVEVHVTSLLRKSGAANRSQLTAWLWAGALVASANANANAKR